MGSEKIENRNGDKSLDSDSTALDFGTSICLLVNGVLDEMAE